MLVENLCVSFTHIVKARKGVSLSRVVYPTQYHNVGLPLIVTGLKPLSIVGCGFSKFQNCFKAICMGRLFYLTDLFGRWFLWKS